MTREERRAWYVAHVTANRKEIEQSEKCGCASCVRIFDASEVEKYVKDRQGDTAICPYCMVDAVIGDACGEELTEKMLDELNREWF